MSVSPTSTQIGTFGMNGGSGQVAYNFNKWLSAVGDVGYYHETDGEQWPDRADYTRHGNFLSCRADGSHTED